MDYKGYNAVVTFDDEAGIFYGEVVDLRDVITFQGTTADELRQAFHDSVEDYLDFCAARGEEPDKSFSGTVPLRMSPDLHRKVFVAAKSKGMSLNAFVTDVMERKVAEMRGAGGTRRKGRE